jgi:hypothetical protein
MHLFLSLKKGTTKNAEKIRRRKKGKETKKRKRKKKGINGE